jgi:mono/diheme cytochrome c family protein
MTRACAVVAFSAWAALALMAAVPLAAARRNPAAKSANPSPYSAILTGYCVGCHNALTRAGGLALDALDVAHVESAPEAWEKVVRKLQRGAMPPQGSRRPDAASYDGLRVYLETELDRAAVAHPDPGRPLLHRLNRTEYAAAIHDLLDLDGVDVASFLPADDASYGFDNVADVLGISATLLERYLDAAGRISALAVGDGETAAASTVYRIRQDLSQDQHLEGLPLGTVGGMAARHLFPRDAEYVFQVKLARTYQNVMRGLVRPSQLEIAIDGERVHLAAVGGDADVAALYEDPLVASDAIDARLRIRVPVKAGQRSVTIAFLQQPPSQGMSRLQPLQRSVDIRDHMRRPHLESVTLTGPVNPGGAGDTASRRRIFTCRPAAGIPESRCASEIVSTLARRAFRRPLDNADRRRLMSFYETGRAKGGFEAGIDMAIRRLLVDPNFVFRIEDEPASAPPGGVYRISDLALASRLSFFLWSTIPDEELLDAASRGTLRQPAVLLGQVRRMLADPRAAALVRNFAGQWLQLRNLANVTPNSDYFPDFDDNLRQAFQQETELLFASIIREDRGVLDLIDADYTFVNERLAKHYGIPYVYGTHFRRIAVTDDARKGLLGHGSILALTSHAKNTSPVLRGKWVLENLLGMPPPAPPPDVPSLDEPASVPARQPTMREQMERHRANPVCANCHKLMDPIGLALENFDAVGAWRADDNGAPIDASTTLLDGTPIDGVVSLRQALLRRPEVLVGTMTEKLLVYGLGRGLDYRDMPTVRAIVRDAGRDHYRFSTLVAAVVTSPPFQMKTKH